MQLHQLDTEGNSISLLFALDTPVFSDSGAVLDYSSLVNKNLYIQCLKQVR